MNKRITTTLTPTTLTPTSTTILRTVIFLSRMGPFSPTCMKIMDFFFENFTLYFTPMTVYKSMKIDVNPNTIKSCMSLLLKNSYLTKEGGNGTNHYNITKENQEFFVTDFRNHVEELENQKDSQKKEPDNLPINDSEDDE